MTINMSRCIVDQLVLCFYKCFFFINSESTIKTVAAVAGSGESVLEKTKADLYLTGEMSHHNILDATQRNTSVILTNHSNSERGYLKEFAKKLQGQIPGLNINISKVDKDPLEFV